MDVVTIAIYIISASFIMIMLALFFAYRRTGHYGMFIMGLTYGASAGLAITITHWWPLVVGYALVWVLKLIGLDPGTDIYNLREAPPGTSDAQSDNGKK